MLHDVKIMFNNNIWEIKIINGKILEKNVNCNKKNF